MIYGGRRAIVMMVAAFAARTAFADPAGMVEVQNAPSPSQTVQETKQPLPREPRSYSLDVASRLVCLEVLDIYGCNGGVQFAEVGITEFHAVDCEQGRAEFEGMTPRRREAIQRRFIKLVTEEVDGFVGVFGTIMLEPYSRLRHRFKEQRRIPPGLSISGSLDHPYYLALQLAIEATAILPVVAALPPNETIDFTFDQHRELGGRVPELFRSMRGDQSLGYTSRLGTIKLLARGGEPGLQAADLLAYEAYRYSDDQLRGGTRERWQFSSLAKRVSSPGYLNEQALLKILE